MKISVALLFLIPVLGWAQQPDGNRPTPTEAPAPPPSTDPPAKPVPPIPPPPEGTRSAETPPKPDAPHEVEDEFIPTEELQPDAAVTFPVDI
jgi:hypothetical protein